MTRPLWIVCGLIPLAAAVALFGRFERPRVAHFVATSRASIALAAVGTVLLAVGISGIATGNLGDIVHSTSRLVLVDITPLQSFALAAAGWLTLRASVTCTDAADRRVSSTPLPGA
jgi:hypothetical protein